MEGFDEVQHIPMVIHQCGHTICHSCIRRLREIDDDERVACPSCRKEFYRSTDASRLYLNFPGGEVDVSNLPACERGALLAYAMREQDVTLLRHLVLWEYHPPESIQGTNMSSNEAFALMKYAAICQNSDMMCSIVKRVMQAEDDCMSEGNSSSMDALITAIVRIIHETTHYATFVWHHCNIYIDNKLFFGYACRTGDTRVHEAVITSHRDMSRSGEFPISQTHFTYDAALAWHALLARPVHVEVVRRLQQGGATIDAAVRLLMIDNGFSVLDVGALSELLRQGGSLEVFEEALCFVIDRFVPNIHDITLDIRQLCQVVACRAEGTEWGEMLLRVLLRNRRCRTQALTTMRTPRSWTETRWMGVRRILRACDALDDELAQTLWQLRRGH
jgi:hypothetical protein